jgi:glycosyltransferase involved in cell wall biosynthesis
MRASAAVIVTADFRARWLASRRWLPQRPLAVAPVFSNLPAPIATQPAARPRPAVGLFGYSYQGAALALILDALSTLEQEGIDVELRLLGAPGPSSSAGEAWRAAARARGLSEALSFSGALDAQALSNELAACDLLLFADTAGPSSRKGTLAGSLASGTAVIAIDGPRTWPELLDARAAEVVAPNAQALAGAIGALLADPQAREALGARGRAFAGQRMGIERTVGAVRGLLEAIAGEGAPLSRATGAGRERR